MMMTLTTTKSSLHALPFPVVLKDILMRTAEKIMKKWYKCMQNMRAYLRIFHAALVSVRLAINLVLWDAGINAENPSLVSQCNVLILHNKIYAVLLYRHPRWSHSRCSNIMILITRQGENFWEFSIKRQGKTLDGCEDDDDCTVEVNGGFGKFYLICVCRNLSWQYGAS